MDPCNNSLAFAAPVATAQSKMTSSFLPCLTSLHCNRTNVFSLPASRHSRMHTEGQRSVPRASASGLSDVLIISGNEALGRVIHNHLSHENVHRLVTTYDPKTSIVSRTGDSTQVHLDLLDRNSVRDVIARVKPSIVISCIGSGGDVSTSPNGNGNGNGIQNTNEGVKDLHELPDLEMTKNVIDACAQCKGIQRFVYVSSLGAGDSEHSVPIQVMTSMRPILLDRTDAEAYVKKVGKESGMKWTIVRPAPLVDEEPTGSAVVTKDVTCYGTVTRADVADALVDIVTSEGTEGSTVHVVDRTKVLITSPYVRPLEFWEGLPFTELKL